MNRKINYKFIIQLVSVFSVLLVPIYYAITFISAIVPEYYYSWDFSNVIEANYTSLAFVLFFAVFLVGFKYMEKITNSNTLILSMLLASISSITMAFTSDYDHYFIIMVCNGVWLGISIPIVYQFLPNIVPAEDPIKKNYITIIAVFLGMIIVASILFISVGTLYWRLIYIITGGIQIAASIYVAKLDFP
jgi:MFS family permease